MELLQCTYTQLHFQLVTKPYACVDFLLQATSAIALCLSEHICDQVT